ncbi:UDP-N-acetylglucosamine--undecaprenyl-phosphate N-acetylglucosaminephosphotransferase [Vibrio maritimus]|uniref:UDP-N-acetylglucosamine--undecaprenyl-phosphate N-acetylglucosaminephosphotransferase n=1 Tax=Vibrio maritimus TaxID=990268 RepID=UPI001F20B591|nr:UDP-N-acetylglucosamine--undecaprenyl-phosphate N-acetylglucosaminephosphotransferase [Vibrio maritimus]
MAWQMISVLVGTFVALLVAHKLAPRLGLVDTPDIRKRHKGQIPLVGGLAIGFALCSALVLMPQLIPYQTLFILSVAALVVLGVLDDRYDLSCRSRLIVQATIAVLIAVLADVQLVTFGDLFGFGHVIFDWLALPLTVIAVIGAINAFNMVDGINGLLGSLASITLLGLSVLFALQGDMTHFQLCMLLLCAIGPYLAFNLGLLGNKYRLFMGDAGSMMIGFVVVWLLFTLTQKQTPLVTMDDTSVRPVTALWLIAVPLMDMVAIMVRRARKGQSPMTPDRGHLHHIFQRIGFDSKQTLFIISAIALFFASVGVIGEVLNVTESTMFYLFLVLFGCYYWILTKIFRFTAYIRLVRRSQPQEVSAG